MNQKQRKAKLKRAQHHQRQSKNPEHYLAKKMIDTFTATPVADVAPVTAPQDARKHIHVQRSRSSISHWFRLALVKMVLTGTSVANFLFPKRH